MLAHLKILVCINHLEHDFCIFRIKVSAHTLFDFAVRKLSFPIYNCVRNADFSNVMEKSRKKLILYLVAHHVSLHYNFSNCCTFLLMEVNYAV